MAENRITLFMRVLLAAAWVIPAFGKSYITVKNRCQTARFAARSWPSTSFQAEGDAEPRFQINDGNSTQLLFGIDVDGLQPGQDAVIDAAAFGYPLKSLSEVPAGLDGYPQPIWDKMTGTIDPAVARYWKEHYDLSFILQRDWKTLGPRTLLERRPDAAELSVAPALSPDVRPESGRAAVKDRPARRGPDELEILIRGRICRASFPPEA